MIKRILFGLVKVVLGLMLFIALIIIAKGLSNGGFFQNASEFFSGKIVPLLSLLIMIGVVSWLHTRGEASRRQIPSIAVAMGIFFTFVGLSWSLLNIAPGGIQQGTETLIAGLSTAFFSSVIGLAMSVGYRVYFAAIEKTSIQKMESQAQRAEKIVNDFTSTIEEGINNSTRRVLEEFNNSLSRSLSQHVEKIENMSASVEKHISDVQIHLSQSNKSAAELTRVVESSVNNAVSTSEKLTEVSNQLLRVTDEFARNVEPFEVQVKQISNLAPTAKNAMEIISRLSEGTESSMNEIASRLEEVTKVVGAESQKSIDNFNGLFAFVDTEYKGIVEKNLQSLDQSIREGFEVLPVEFKDSLQKTFEQYIVSMKQSISEFEGQEAPEESEKEEQLA